MKQLISVVGVLLLTGMFAVTAVAGDKSIMFEFGLGFGDSGATSYSKEERKKIDLTKCRNRNSEQMTYIGVRLRSNDVELHGAKWWHDTEIANCNRDNYVVGLGYVISTEDEVGTQGNSKYHASWTPGLAYIVNTNWRMTDNWAMFNRLAVGGEVSSKFDVEVAVNRYGSLYSNHGETFGTVAIKYNDRINNDPVVNGEPPACTENCDEPPLPPEQPPACTENCDEPPLPPEQPPACTENCDEPPVDDGEKGNHPNNGGGNGSEGSSPGQGSGANDDETP